MQNLLSVLMPISRMPTIFSISSTRLEAVEVAVRGRGPILMVQEGMPVVA